MSHGKNADLFEWWPEIPLFSPGEFFPPSIFGHARCESERWSVYRGPIITIIDGFSSLDLERVVAGDSRHYDFLFASLWENEQLREEHPSLRTLFEILRKHFHDIVLNEVQLLFVFFLNPSIRVICRDSDAQDTLTFADEMRITLRCQVSS